MAWLYWEWQGAAYFRQQEALDARRKLIRERRKKGMKRKKARKVPYPVLSFTDKLPR